MRDFTTKRYYFEHTDMPIVVWVDLGKLDLKAGTPLQRFDLESDFDANGEVSGRVQPAKPLAFQKAGTAVQWKPAPREPQRPVSPDRIPAMTQTK